MSSSSEEKVDISNTSPNNIKEEPGSTQTITSSSTTNTTNNNNNNNNINIKTEANSGSNMTTSTWKQEEQGSSPQVAVSTTNTTTNVTALEEKQQLEQEEDTSLSTADGGPVDNDDSNANTTNPTATTTTATSTSTLDRSPSIVPKRDKVDTMDDASVEEGTKTNNDDSIVGGDDTNDNDDNIEEGRIAEGEEDEQKDDDAGDATLVAKDLPYSTRGRSSTNNNNNTADTEYESRVTRETLEDIGRKEPTTTAASLGTSFLESLSEEERRMRTRFLPEVDGMHSLRKLEIKEDLHLARALAGASSSSSSNAKKKKRRTADDDSMDIDRDGAISPMDEASDVPKSGHSIEMRTRDLYIPSHAFLVPPGTKTDDDGTGSGGRTSPVPTKSQNGVQSPLVVDSMVAFNPPRPAESMGAKKKHRMLRWERRPEDVETDLNNYRKTVQRTRQELQNAEGEYERLETIDAHLRWHFLKHLDLLNEEYLRLNDEMGSIQQDCIKSADLFASRTRSRGAGKGSYVMRDVLAVLKNRGTAEGKQDAMEVTDGTNESKPKKTQLPAIVPGLGGVPMEGFSDLKHDTTFAQHKPATAWLVAGDKVKTPYGEGEVVTIHPASLEKRSSSDDTGVDATSGGEGTVSGGGTSKPGEPKKRIFQPAAIIPPRVSVQLPFGIGHFSISNITPLENPAMFSDAQLKKRWKSMAETAVSIGGALDTGAMCAIDPISSTEETEEESGMEIEKSGTPGEGTTGSGVGGGIDDLDDEDARLLPFGSGMLPTAFGRGAFLATMPIEEIEREIHHALYNGKGVLGRPENPGVPDHIKKWETDEQEFLTLQAEALHLRNTLIRQRRIRLLNERSNSTAKERYERAEGLVSEMRSDLKSLKHRLDADLAELGIDEVTAEKILIEYYRGEDMETGEASPLKRQRRLTRTEEDLEGESVHIVNYGDEVDRDSLGDMSGDEMDSLRATKKIRPSQ